MQIIKRAGLKPWPKPFQNLRSTRETELMEKFPAHVVCGWIGNSEAIALKHYLQVTDDHFERAVRGEAEIGPEVAPIATNPAAQKWRSIRTQGGSSEPQAAQATNAKAPELPGPATSCDIVNACSVPHGESNPGFRAENPIATSKIPEDSARFPNSAAQGAVHGRTTATFEPTSTK